MDDMRVVEDKSGIGITFDGLVVPAGYVLLFTLFSRTQYPVTEAHCGIEIAWQRGLQGRRPFAVVSLWSWEFQTGWLFAREDQR
jgi:hypothetical protein